MHEGPYRFQPEDAFRFARERGIKARQIGDNLHFEKCPYCGGGGSNDKKTFAIDLRTGVFNCLRGSCLARGNMVTLSRDFGFSLGNEMDAYYRPDGRYKTYGVQKAPIEPKDPALRYLKGRGISERVAKKYEITTYKDTENVLVFPFYSPEGSLDFIKYRRTDFVKGRDKAKEWSEAGMKPILFGMKQCNPENRTLIITEGQMDSLSVAEAGIENAVSVPTGAKGFTWVPHCWNFVHRFETIIVFGDHEKGHITLLDEIKSRFRLRIKHVREEDYLECKDANDILRKYGAERIKACVRNAVDVPVERVIDLADVENVNPYDVEKLPTGFSALDSILYGGLPFGGLCVIAGKRGQGKSTVASQIIVNAIDRGYSCFCYSGEMAGHLFRSWMDFQAAGPGHVHKYRTAMGHEGWAVSEGNRKRLGEWYRGKVGLYDSTGLDEDVSLLETMDEYMGRYGARVALVDNLMTGLDLEASAERDKYERQGQFVKKLARIALKRNAVVILVAHKRKNGFDGDENDEISGSGDISNLASVVLAYEEGKKDGDIKPDQRLLKLTKNRLFGRTNREGWVMDYNVASKRVYGPGDDPERAFGWYTPGPLEGFVDAGEEELPFDR